MKVGYKKTQEKAAAKLTKGWDMTEPKPSISLDTELLPAVKNWKVDQEYTIKVKVKMTGLHKKYDSDKLCGDFEVLSAEELK